MATATTPRTRRSARAQANKVDTKTPTVAIPIVKPASAPTTQVATKEGKMEIMATLVPGKVAIAGMTPEKLKMLAFISTYSTHDPQSSSPRNHGYQREPMEERFPGIARYYAKDDNRFKIPALIISVRVYNTKDRNRFNTLFNAGNISKIHQEFGKSVFSIVDGQHRMGGLYYGWKNDEEFNCVVPITLYYGLNYAEEASFFDEVNTNQRKLPKALIEATKVHTEAGEESHAQTIRKISFELAEDGDSVWNGLVNMTGRPKAVEPVSFEGLRRSVGDLLPVKVINRLEQRGYKPENVAKRFWALVAKACAPAWTDQPRFVENAEHETVEEQVKYRLKDVVGVAAVSLLGSDILLTSLDKTENDADFWDSVAEYVSKLGAVDWEKRKNNPWMATSAGFGGQRQLYSMLYDLVYTDQAPGVAVEADEK
jgi:DGQHR domain-containing protein